MILKRKATGKLTAVFEFNRYGNLKAIYLSSENDQDQAVLVKGLAEILRPNKSLLKRIFRGLDERS